MLSWRRQRTARGDGAAEDQAIGSTIGPPRAQVLLGQARHETVVVPHGGAQARELRADGVFPVVADSIVENRQLGQAVVPLNRIDDADGQNRDALDVSARPEGPRLSSAAVGDVVGRERAHDDHDQGGDALHVVGELLATRT